MSSVGLSDRFERAQPILEKYRESLFSRARFDCHSLERELIEVAELGTNEIPQLLCDLSTAGRYRHVAAFYMQHMLTDGPDTDYKVALTRYYRIESFDSQGANTAREYWMAFQKWTDSRRDAMKFLRGVLEKCYEIQAALRTERKKESPDFRSLQSRVNEVRESVDAEVYRLKQYVVDNDRWQTRRRDPSQAISLCEFNCLVKVQHKLHDLPFNLLSPNFVDEIHIVEAESDVGLSYVEEINPD